MKTTKNYAVAILAASILGVGMATPAFAAETVPPEVQPASVTLQASTDESALLQGPNGTFSIAPADASETSLSIEASNAAADGELRLTSSIESSTDSPIEYTLALPNRATAEVAVNDDDEQSIVLRSAAGDLLGGIAAVDVRDANGASVPTNFTVEGSTVTQSIAHNLATEVAFPVSVVTLAGTVWYSSAWVTTDNRGYIVNANPTDLGRQQIAWNLHGIHVQHLKQILGSQAYRVNWNIEQQFVCHVVGAWAKTGVYNMESWQPALAWQEIANIWDRCNRLK